MDTKQAIEWIKKTKFLDKRLTEGKVMCLAISALSKQVPMKPKGIFYRFLKRNGTCACGEWVKENEAYCSHCGQAIDWIDGEGMKNDGDN